MLRPLARHQRLAQRRRAVAVERQQQAAAGSAIEAMDEEDLPAELLAQPVRGEVALPARQLAVVDHQASGLVNDGKELVAIQNGKLLPPPLRRQVRAGERSEEHTSELQSLMRISYA